MKYHFNRKCNDFLKPPFPAAGADHGHVPITLMDRAQWTEYARLLLAYRSNRKCPLLYRKGTSLSVAAAAFSFDPPAGIPYHTASLISPRLAEGKIMYLVPMHDGLPIPSLLWGPPSDFTIWGHKENKLYSVQVAGTSGDCARVDLSQGLLYPDRRKKTFQCTYPFSPSKSEGEKKRGKQPMIPLPAVPRVCFRATPTHLLWALTTFALLSCATLSADLMQPLHKMSACDVS